MFDLNLLNNPGLQSFNKNEDKIDNDDKNKDVVSKEKNEK